MTEKRQRQRKGEDLSPTVPARRENKGVPNSSLPSQREKKKKREMGHAEKGCG